MDLRAAATAIVTVPPTCCDFCGRPMTLDAVEAFLASARTAGLPDLTFALCSSTACRDML